MVIETLLTTRAARLTRRYLAFEQAGRHDQPVPDANTQYLLYIHIPFCEELCPFCSFTRVRFDADLAKTFFAALKTEIRVCHDRGFRFGDVYIGGGTPTIIPAELAEVVSLVRSFWPISQLSVETNPSHLVGDTLAVLRDIGTNRLSVGVQSFDNAILEDMRYRHKYGSSETIRQKLAAVIGAFDTVNVDMIFNFSGQTDKTLAADIRIVNELGVDQVTWYPLMLSETKKRLLVEGRGRFDYVRERRLYEMIVDGLAGAYRQESVWCYSKRAGLIDEYPVTHEQYLGVGPGALSYLGGNLCINAFLIPEYVHAVNDRGSSLASIRRFSPAEQLRFDLLLKLLGGTADIRAMREKHGRFWRVLWPEITFLLAARAATLRDGRLTLTRKGRYYWLTVMRTLLSMLGEYRDSRAGTIGSDKPTSAGILR